MVRIGLIGFGVGFGIKFNSVGAGALCRRDKFRVGIEEN